MTDNQNRIQFDVKDVLSGCAENFDDLLAAWVPDDEERNELNLNIPAACRQMSQLVAWTWLDDAKTEPAEKELKKRFAQALENQANNNNPEYSQEISDLFIGKEKQGELTLADLYKKLVGEVNEYVYTPDFVRNFYFEVVKSNEGYIAFPGEKPDDNTSKIIVALPYPNRPDNLDESKLEELKSWATDLADGGWKPPQDWIPFASF